MCIAHSFTLIVIEDTCLFIVYVEMSKRKTSTPCDVKKPLRKMRALSGYNLWHGEYLRSQGITHNQKINIHCT